jgi:SAM-dependent methyltransferase
MANAERLPFADHFDVMIATDILEHVLNVGAFLYSANRALRPGGRLYVRVPFRENLLQYAPQTGCPYRFVHLRTYDRPLLRQTLEEAGFAVEGMWSDGLIAGFRRRVWQEGRIRPKLYGWFEEYWKRGGRDLADVTLRPHRFRRLFLRPTAIVAAARKVKSLAPAVSALKPVAVHSKETHLAPAHP